MNNEELLCEIHNNSSMLLNSQFQDNIHLKNQLNYLKKIFSKYTNRVYIVGGFIRDMLLNKKCYDIDLEVYDISYENFENLMKELKADDKGKKFFVYKWKDIDISLPRTEIKVSDGYYGFKVSISNDEKEASKRRDFTMNALMYNIYTNKILDFYGGISDIKNKTIKAVDFNIFVQDDFRKLRALRFGYTLGFKIEKDTYNLMKNMSLQNLRKKQILNEFGKID